MDLITFSWNELRQRASEIARLIRGQFPTQSCVAAYAIPNGGIPAALLVQNYCHSLELCESPDAADVFLDDVIDSGETRSKFTNGHTRPFFALVDKQGHDRELIRRWVSFPWERARNDTGPQDAIRRIIQYIGDDVKREGLLETPDRVVRSYAELFSGYTQDPKSVMKTFEDGACDEIVLLRNVEFYSICEHHMQPFFGIAHIGYLPDGSVVGVSKLARVLDIYSRRLQIQERLCQQVTQALDQYLKPKGSACILEASHFCMRCRGVQKQHSEMVTSSLTGIFRQNPAVRSELFSLIKR